MANLPVTPLTCQLVYSFRQRVSYLLLSGKSLKHIVMLLPFQGATAPTRDTQGAASLALGSVLHWAFSPHLQKS